MPPTTRTAEDIQADPGLWPKILGFAQHHLGDMQSLANRISSVASMSPQTAAALARRSYAAIGAGIDLTSTTAGATVPRSQIPVNPTIPAGMAYRTRVIVTYKDPVSGRENRIYHVLEWESNPSLAAIEGALREEQEQIQQDAYLKYRNAIISTPVIDTITVHTLERRT